MMIPVVVRRYSAGESDRKRPSCQSDRGLYISLRDVKFRFVDLDYGIEDGMKLDTSESALHLHAGILTSWLEIALLYKWEVDYAAT